MRPWWSDLCQLLQTQGRAKNTGIGVTCPGHNFALPLLHSVVMEWNSMLLYTDIELLAHGGHSEKGATMVVLSPHSHLFLSHLKLQLEWIIPTCLKSNSLASTAFVCMALIPESSSTSSLQGPTHAHPVQVTILLWSFWDCLSGLVAPLWGGVPESPVSTSIWAFATLCLPVYSSLSSRPESCDFHYKPLAQGLTHSRSSKMVTAWMAFCHVTHLQK